jgi:hypothetical protein
MAWTMPAMSSPVFEDFSLHMGVFLRDGVNLGRSFVKRFY